MADQAEKLRQVALRNKVDERDTGRLEGKFPRVIAVTSGKGGVGKTNLVVNLGVTLTRWNYRVIILDADLGMANVDVMTNAFPRYSLEDVINGHKDIREVMVEPLNSLKIIPGGSGMFNLANLDRQRQDRLIERLGVLDREADILLIDTGAGISQHVINFLASAGEILLVTTPEPTALTDVYGLIKVLHEKKTHRKVHTVVNMVKNVAEGEEVFQRLNKVVNKFLGSPEIGYLGAVNMDPQVTRSISDCYPLVLNRPRSPAAISIQKISRRLLFDEDMSRAEVNLKGMQGFIERLKKSF